jgi:hypothetical protein
MAGPISEELEDWIFATYHWLLTEFGGFADFEETHLVLPNEDFFPIGDADDVAQAIFDCVKGHAGLDSWPCKLEMRVGDNHAEAMRGLAYEYKSSGAAGTFSIDDKDAVVITYNEHQLRDPMSLVATFAHELAHYLLATAKTDPPGTEEAEEPATDLAAVFMGFGIFIANGAFQFEQFTDGMMQGWRSAHLGYLSEASLAYALAIFALLKGLPDRAVRKHLDPNPSGYFKQARKHIEKRRSHDMDALRAIKGPDKVNAR